MFLKNFINKRKSIKKAKKRFKNSNVSFFVFFDMNTSLGGYNCVNGGTEINGSKIGKGTYIGKYCILSRCDIGSFCSIGNYVKVVPYNHPISFVSTNPIFFDTSNNLPLGKSKNHFKETIERESCVVEIGNDVWVGDNVLIKGGIKIGDGAVIGMGSVVTKDVEPYSIVAGCPARTIRKRFSDEQINKMLIIKWWDWELDKILQNREKFNDVDNFVKEFI